MQLCAYVGFVTQEIQIKIKRSRITLQEDVQTLKEVVVIAMEYKKGKFNRSSCFFEGKVIENVPHLMCTSLQVTIAI